jgi:DNA-binding response OmpR family regulator
MGKPLGFRGGITQTQPEAGVPAQGETGLDLSRVIEKAIESSAGRVGRREVSIVAEYPAHLPEVTASESELIQVISSLVTLAARMVGQGEIRVRAELLSAGEAPKAIGLWTEGLDKLADGGPWALVRVSSTAQGPIGKLDDLLQEGQPSAADMLSIPECRRLIEQFGGTFWIETPLREVPSLAITLPLVAATSTSPDVSSLRRVVDEHLPEGGEAEKTLLLMVVDDDLRAALARDLVETGYRAVVAASGGDVLSLARREKPDLILLDLLAREPDAFEIAMVLKQDRRTRNMPLLFLTSTPDPDAGGPRMGAVNFLVRPVGTGALVSAINAVLNALPSPSSRVLVIEADNAIREMMILMIQAHGYRVTEASGPEEALALAEHVNPGLILVNAGLAQERDYWLLRSLRQLEGDFDIFVLADAMSDAEGRAAISRGASGYSETGKLPDLLDRVRGRKETD